MIKSKHQLRKKVLVTGGSGYIGTVLVPTLIQKGFFVRVIDIALFRGTLPKQYRKYFEYIQSDIRKITATHLKDIFAIIHLAAFSDEASANENPTETKKVNTYATIALAKKAKKANVKRFIFASSASLYDFGMAHEKGAQEERAPISPTGVYSTSKLAAEKKLLTLSDDKFPVIILRKATVCGYSPNMRFDLVVNAMVKSVLSKGYIRVFCKGLQWRPLISIEDIATAYCKTLTTRKQNINGQIFNIGFDNFQVKDIAFLVEKTVSKHFSLYPKIIFEQDERKDRSYRMNTGKAKKMLGFRPKVTIEQAIVDLVRNSSKKVYNV